MRRRRAGLGLAAGAALIAGPAGADTRADLRRFDIVNVEDWADALALCDLTAFLRTRPALDADAIIPSGDRPGPLYGPRFLPPGLFFDRGVRRTFERLQRAGETDRARVASARARYDLDFYGRLRNPSASEVAFLEEQSSLCAALSIDIDRRFPDRTAALPGS